MSCALSTIVACFNMANFYVDASLLVQDRGVAEITRIPSITTIDGQTFYTTAVTDAAANPYGRFSIGYAIDLGSLTFAIEGAHLSSTRESWDRGINSIEFRARWYPFR